WSTAARVSCSVLIAAPGSLAYSAASCFSAAALVGWQPSVEPSESLITAHWLAAQVPPPCSMCHGVVIASYEPAAMLGAGACFGGQKRSNSASCDGVNGARS